MLRMACFVGLAAMGMAAAAHAQSYDCRKAHFADEKVICGSPDLSRLDDRLDWVYEQAFRRLPRAEQRALDKREDEWVVMRRRCGSDTGCIASAYHSRIRELAHMAGQRPGEIEPDGEADSDESRAVKNPIIEPGAIPSRNEATAAERAAARVQSDRSRKKEASVPPQKPVSPQQEFGRTPAPVAVAPTAPLPQTVAPPRPAEPPAPERAAGMSPQAAPPPRLPPPAPEPASGTTKSPPSETFDPSTGPLTPLR